MRLRSWHGSTPVSTSEKRRFPWARLVLVLAILGAAAYVLIPRYYYLQADALVQGDLVPVSPLYRARIDQLYVHCDDHVSAGQRVAVISNFIMNADYQRQYLQNAAQMRISQVNLSEQVAAARANAENMKEKYEAASVDADRAKTTFMSYDQAYKQGAIAQIDWQEKRSLWQSSVALENSARDAWQRAEQEVERITVDQNSRIASDQEISDQSQALAQRVAQEPLISPVSGYIVDCVARPQNVIEPSSPIFNIFDPNRAYVLAYFSPSSVEKLQIDQPVEISVAGVNHKLTGRIAAIYPNLDKLPPQLTRFFWQHVQWTQYRPVKIALDSMAKSDRARLYYDAQARVSIRLRGTDKAAEKLSKN